MYSLKAPRSRSDFSCFEPSETGFGLRGRRRRGKLYIGGDRRCNEGSHFEELPDGNFIPVCKKVRWSSARTN